MPTPGQWLYDPRIQPLIVRFSRSPPMAGGKHSRAARSTLTSWASPRGRGRLQIFASADDPLQRIGIRFSGDLRRLRFTRPIQAGLWSSRSTPKHAGAIAALADHLGLRQAPRSNVIAAIKRRHKPIESIPAVMPACAGFGRRESDPHRHEGDERQRRARLPFHVRSSYRPRFEAQTPPKWSKFFEENRRSRNPCSVKHKAKRLNMGEDVVASGSSPPSHPFLPSLLPTSAGRHAPRLYDEKTSSGFASTDGVRIV